MRKPTGARLLASAWPVLCTLAGAPACTESNTSARPTTTSPRPALVELETVRAGSLTDGWTYLGQVEPALASDLATAVAGHVLAVNVREGDHVARGKVLLTVDSAKVRAELAAARAREQGLDTELALAQRQLERVQTLSYPTISEPEKERYEREVKNLQAQLAIQQAEVQRVQVELARHTLHAPFAGVVGRRLVDPGAWVGAGQPVLSLVSLDDLEIHVDVSARLGARLAVGQHARLLGPTAVDAEIAGIVSALDASTRTMRVRLVPRGEPASRPGWLLAGMAVDVEFPIDLSGDGSDGVIISRDALIQSPVGIRVLVYRDGAAVPVRVEVLATADNRVLVRPEARTGAGASPGASTGAGSPDEAARLAPGDKVVIRGNERLRPGQPVQVVERGSAASADAPDLTRPRPAEGAGTED